MFDRPPPSTILVEIIGEEGLNLKVSELALKLDISRVHLSRVLNGHSPISPLVALKLEANNIGNAEHWMRMQTAYDLDQARLSYAG